MGNSDLREICSITPFSYKELSGQTVVVDGHNWLYKYMLTAARYNDRKDYTTSEGVELPVLIGATQGLQRFFEYNITPLFILDGVHHEAKKAEVSQRKKQKEESAKKAKGAKERGEYIKAAKLNARSKYLTDDMITAVKKLFDHLDVTYSTAPSAGEAQAAYIAQKEDGIHHVISDDYDSVLFRSPSTVRNFTSSKRELELLNLEETLQKTDFEYKQLVDCAILCGTDYNPGVQGYGPKTSIKEIKKHGDIFTLIEQNDLEIEDIETIREIFTNPNVSDDYTLPVVPNPQIQEAREYLKEKEINLSKVIPALETIEEEDSQPTLNDWA